MVVFLCFLSTVSTAFEYQLSINTKYIDKPTGEICHNNITDISTSVETSMPYNNNSSSDASIITKEFLISDNAANWIFDSKSDVNHDDENINMDSSRSNNENNNNKKIGDVVKNIDVAMTDDDLGVLMNMNENVTTSNNLYSNKNGTYIEILCEDVSIYMYSDYSMLFMSIN